MSSNPCYSGLRRQTAEGVVRGVAYRPRQRVLLAARLECIGSLLAQGRGMEMSAAPLRCMAVRESTSHWGLCLCLVLFFLSDWLTFGVIQNISWVQETNCGPDTLLVLFAWILCWPIPGSPKVLCVGGLPEDPLNRGYVTLWRYVHSVRTRLTVVSSTPTRCTLDSWHKPNFSSDHRSGNSCSIFIASILLYNVVVQFSRVMTNNKQFSLNYNVNWIL